MTPQCVAPLVIMGTVIPNALCGFTVMAFDGPFRLHKCRRWAGHHWSDRAPDRECSDGTRTW